MHTPHPSFVLHTEMRRWTGSSPSDRRQGDFEDVVLQDRDPAHHVAYICTLGVYPAYRKVPAGALDL